MEAFFRGGLTVALIEILSICHSTCQKNVASTCLLARIVAPFFAHTFELLVRQGQVVPILT